jgi:hypothetical protein
MSGSTNLLASWEEKEERRENGFIVRSFSIGGDRHAMAILAAVIDRYSAISGRERPTEERLYDLIGQKVTLVQHGENMLGGGLLVAQEGKLFTGSSGGFGILPKGARSKGYRVKPERVLDVFPGYATAEAIEVARKVREHFPVVTALTPERLRELPPRSNTLSLCMFGTWRMPDSKATDALYLAHSYMREEDIVEGMLLIRPEHGYSEHGSAWGRQLLDGPMGEVPAFQPISFDEGMALCDLDFDEAYERVIGNCVSA